MPSGTDQVVLALESGIRVLQQGLFQWYRAPLREAGLSLHLAAFAGACYGIHFASEREMDLPDLHARVEKALRHLCADWDDRPLPRRRFSVAEVLRRLGDRYDEAPAEHDLRAVYLAVPAPEELSLGAVPAEPTPGDRGDYVVGRYRRYVDRVYLFSCDPKQPNTWDEGGGELVLERALFDDVYGASGAPTPHAARSVFGLVIRSYRSAEAGGDGAA